MTGPPAGAVVNKARAVDCKRCRHAQVLSEVQPGSPLQSVAALHATCTAEPEPEPMSDPISEPVSEPISEPVSEPVSEPLLLPPGGGVIEPHAAVKRAAIIILRIVLSSMPRVIGRSLQELRGTRKCAQTHRDFARGGGQLTDIGSAVGAVRRSVSTTQARPTEQSFSLLTSDDLFLFNQGTHYRLYDKLGAHVVDGGDVLRGVGAERARGQRDRRLERLGATARHAARARVERDLGGRDQGRRPRHALQVRDRRPRRRDARQGGSVRDARRASAGDRVDRAGSRSTRGTTPSG